MSTELGVTSQSQALQNLVAGSPKYMPLLIDAAATAVVGQVVQYNVANNNWDDYTAGMALPMYAVIAEAATLGGDTNLLCLVGGEVRKEALDATAQADGEIEIALGKHGIQVRPSSVV